jgi:hypothetical protein
MRGGGSDVYVAYVELNVSRSVNTNRSLQICQIFCLIFAAQLWCRVERHFCFKFTLIFSSCFAYILTAGAKG